MNKNILLASFIFPERLEWFLSYLDNKFGIEKEKVFAASKAIDIFSLLKILNMAVSTHGSRTLSLNSKSIQTNLMIFLDLKCL